MRNSQGSGDYRNSAAERDAPDLKSYLEPVNVKTDKELKSEIFNRKQIINSARDTFDNDQPRSSYENTRHAGQFRVFSAAVSNDKE